MIKPRLTKYPLAIGIIMVLFSLFSCENEIMVNQSHGIEDEIWLADDSLVFPFRVEDTLNAYDMSVQVRHTTDYPYRNLFLFVETHIPGRNATRDTIEFILAEPDGKWIGSGFGRLKYDDILVRRALVFPDTGDYRFVFWQAMREDSLKGVRDLGIKITESELDNTRQNNTTK